MLKVNFYENGSIEESQLKFAVVVASYKGKWIFCKHQNRETFEIPGGHREENESILETARRELFEETGALRFELTPICVYSVKRENESFGMLYFAKVEELGELPRSEIERIELFEAMPEYLTYPLIQPKLMEQVVSSLNHVKECHLMCHRLS